MQNNTPQNLTQINSRIETCLNELQIRNRSPHTILCYRKALTQLDDYLQSIDIHRPQDVIREHLDAFRLHLADKNYANETVYLYLRCTRHFFNYLATNHLIFVNPAGNLKMPRYRRKLQAVPSEQDIAGLLSQPDTTTIVGIRDRAIMETIYCCGLRRDEVMRMTLSDPDLDQQVLRVNGKGSRERNVPLGHQAIRWIRTYLDHSRPKLCNDEDEHALWISYGIGKKLSYGGIDRVIRKHARKAGIKRPISTHSLRRACATHMLKNGAHPLELQLLLGHSDLKHLKQYLQVTITDMKKMHERSKLGK